LPVQLYSYKEIYFQSHNPYFTQTVPIKIAKLEIAHMLEPPYFWGYSATVLRN